jgi:hypothetical protein
MSTYLANQKWSGRHVSRGRGSDIEREHANDNFYHESPESRARRQKIAGVVVDSEVRLGLVFVRTHRT